MRLDRLSQKLLLLAGVTAHVPEPAPERPGAGEVALSPVRLVVGVVLGVVIWIASTYGVSRFLDDSGASVEPMRFWWAGAVAGVVAAIVIAGARRTVAIAMTAALTLVSGLLAWQLVWAVVSGMD